MNEDLDFRAIARYLTPGNVAKWIAVISFGVLAVIVLTFLAAFLWGAV